MMCAIMSSNLVDTSSRQIADLHPQSGPLAFGCWRFTHSDLAVARGVLEAAVDLGMVLVDTADIYGRGFGGTGHGAAEEILGRVLAESPRLRARILLATKGGILPPVPYDSSASALRAACEASLRRLQVDVIDLYQVHRPDLFAHPAEVAETLTRLKDEGKIAAVGVSNFTVPQHDALAAMLAERGVEVSTSQPEYSVSCLQPLRDGTLDRCMAGGVVPLAWSPLAGGRLVSGDGARPEVLAVLDELAEREGVDRAAIAIAFVIAHPSRPVAILGSQSPERLRAATRALEVFLDRQDCYRLVEASEGVPLP